MQEAIVQGGLVQTRHVGCVSGGAWLKKEALQAGLLD